MISNSTRPPQKTKEEYMSSPSKVVYHTREEEAVAKFELAQNWVGLKVKDGVIAQFIWPWLGSQTENEMLHDSKNITAREECIKYLIEFHCRINSEDINIYEHYITSTTGVIMWFRTDKHIAQAIYKAAPKMRTDECQIQLYIPDVARDRKRHIDRLFMEYKTQRDKNFRYLVKNTSSDIEILVKSVDPNRGGPYRKIDLALLGEIPDLKLKIDKKETAHEIDPNKFTKVTSRRKKKLGKKTSQNRIFNRLDRFLERLEPLSDDDLSCDEMSS